MRYYPRIFWTIWLITIILLAIAFFTASREWLYASNVAWCILLIAWATWGVAWRRSRRSKPAASRHWNGRVIR